MKMRSWDVVTDTDGNVISAVEVPTKTVDVEVMMEVLDPFKLPDPLSPAARAAVKRIAEDNIEEKKIRRIVKAYLEARK